MISGYNLAETLLKQKNHLLVVLCKWLIFNLWAQLGLNQRPSDYESDAANQLSYGPDPRPFRDRVRKDKKNINIQNPYGSCSIGEKTYFC